MLAVHRQPDLVESRCGHGGDPGRDSAGLAQPLLALVDGSAIAGRANPRGRGRPTLTIAPGAGILSCSSLAVSGWTRDARRA
jgi:hypothetical protein